MKHILLRVLSNVEGITHGCDVAKLTWNNAIRTALRNRTQAFHRVDDPGLVEVVYRLPTVTYFEAPTPGADVDLDEAFGESAYIVVNNSFVNALSPSDATLADSFLVVFEGGFKWRTYIADSEVIHETEELPWEIVDKEV